MSLFKKAKETPPAYPPEEYEAVIRSSICTGEKVGCVRERSTGKLRELMLIRSGADLESFCRLCGVSAEEIRTIY